jgi:hypothetical protein
MVLYAFNFVVVVGVGFLVAVLRRFVQEARPHHGPEAKKSHSFAQPLEMLKSSGRAHRTVSTGSR